MASDRHPMPPCNSVPKHPARRPWPCEARPAGSYQPLEPWATCEATRVRSPRSWVRPRSCSRMDSTAGIGQRRSGRTPRGDEPRLVHKGSRAALVGRMREHRRRTGRPVNPLRKQFVDQQRELPLAEERPPRPMVRAALTSDACKKGEGSEGRSHIPLGMARGAVSKEPAPKSGSRGLEGEVAGSQGGLRFLGWITSRSTTPCLMHRKVVPLAAERARETEAGIVASTAIHLVASPPSPEGPSKEGGRVSRHGPRAQARGKCGGARSG
jgi:hypothetical protein